MKRKWGFYASHLDSNSWTVLMGSFTQEIAASQIIAPPGCGENTTTVLFLRSGPEMFKCRPKEITSILSEKEIHRPVASQARSARITKKRRLRDLESDSTGAESEDDFVMSNRWDEVTHMLCILMALLSSFFICCSVAVSLAISV